MGNESTLVGIILTGMVLHLPRPLVLALLVLALVTAHFEKGGKHGK